MPLGIWKETWKDFNWGHRETRARQKGVILFWLPSLIFYQTLHRGCKPHGQILIYIFRYEVEGVWREAINLVPVVDAQLLKSIWTTFLKLFCIQTMKHKAPIATVCFQTQFVLCPFKYQRCWSPHILNQCLTLIEACILFLPSCWLCSSFSLYLVLSNILFSSLVFLPDFILALWIFLSIYVTLCGLASKAFSGLKYRMT